MKKQTSLIGGRVPPRHACPPPREIGEILDCISRILMVDKEDIDYWKEVNRPSRNY